MHLEHRAAEEDAEERRELRRRAKKIKNLTEEGEVVLEEQSLENEWSESLVREKREVAQKRKHNRKTKYDYVIFRTETWLDDRKESVYRKNPNFRNVLLVKKMMEEKDVSHDEESWLAEPLPQANKRVFIKDPSYRKKRVEKAASIQKTHHGVELNERSRPAHTGIRPRLQVVNLYRDITSL
ncbi:hypothetical protein RRG08_049196 [Elysia crispata]|uniref:Uncharacterized protein n=1 Tax=Elysia crispata TaxID=231223 RepID=A0AAE1D1T4_9GAST|nr:hypothetical protein RRG08_049196 [Elysia crispata]